MSDLSVNLSTISNESIYKDPTLVSVLKSAAVSQHSGSAELCNCLHVLSRILYNEGSHARLLVENAIGKENVEDLVKNKLPKFSNEADIDEKELRGIAVSEQAMQVFQTALELSQGTSTSTSTAISDMQLLFAYLRVNGEESIFYKLYGINIEDLINELKAALSSQQDRKSSAA